VTRPCDYDCCPCARNAFNFASVQGQCNKCNSWVESTVLPQYQSYCSSSACTAYSTMPYGYTTVTPNYYYVGPYGRDGYAEHLETEAQDITDYRGPGCGGGPAYSPGCQGQYGAQTIFMDPYQGRTAAGMYTSGYYGGGGRDPYYGYLSPYAYPGAPVHSRPYVDDWSQRDGLGAYASVVPTLEKRPTTAPTTGKSHHRGSAPAETTSAREKHLLEEISRKNAEIMEMAEQLRAEKEKARTHA